MVSSLIDTRVAVAVASSAYAASIYARGKPRRKQSVTAAALDSTGRPPPPPACASRSPFSILPRTALGSRSTLTQRLSPPTRRLKMRATPPTIETATVATLDSLSAPRSTEDAVAEIERALEPLDLNQVKLQLRRGPVLVCLATEAEWGAFTSSDKYLLGPNFMVWQDGKVLIVELPLAPQQDLVSAVSTAVVLDTKDVRKYLWNHGASHTTNQRHEADASFGPVCKTVRPLGAEVPSGLANWGTTTH